MSVEFVFPSLFKFQFLREILSGFPGINKETDVRRGWGWGVGGECPVIVVYMVVFVPD